jgi:hypothetical protein
MLKRLVGAKPLIIFGALDTPDARQTLLQFSTTGIPGHYHTYIDGGNDGNRGQVLYANGFWGIEENSRWTRVKGHLLFPEVFTAQPAAEAGSRGDSCSLAIDTQTPLANNMAATLMLNYFGALLHGQMIGSVGVSFTTIGAIDYHPGILASLKPPTAYTSHREADYIPLSVHEANMAVIAAADAAKRTELASRLGQTA